MADERTVRVLLVDDDEDDYVITRDLLAEADAHRFAIDWLATFDCGLTEILRARHDVYLLDYRLGERNGLELLREALRLGCKHPMILLTGQGDEAVDLEAMRSGAADYLVKGQTDARLLERSIRYALERRRVEEIKDRLLAFASHELRTPVAVIRGFAETILLQDRQELSDGVLEYVDNIIQAADHLTRLIDGFLDLSKIEAGRPIELTKGIFDVRSLVAEAIRIADMAARHCEFEATFDDEIGDLNGDRYKLLLVLINLLSNADKYWPDGGVVKVHIACVPGAVVFTVADKGIGIAPEGVEGLFTPFYRVRDPRGRGVQGTGLGLYLSKHLIEAHGGEIRVESAPGEGSTFQVTLPM